ncbi:uncharacterized protein LOC123311889 [Coccinella septempunctata]|uniref:uncharacterized protein LOC123311889 n=1 Tax=Coccinella septempunctata TaxID=41139 RepID=UPI001D062A0A|nr:uncharacterized protein LOC123311889 [Coccinella septempunctata]
MSEVLICLSSDDENEPPAKKIKISPVAQIEKEVNEKDKKENNLNDSIICLDSDEENDSQDVVMINKENLETNGSTEASVKNALNDPNQIEVINCSPLSTLNLSNGLSDKDTDESEISNSSSSSETEYYEEEELQSHKKQNSHSEEQSDSSSSKGSDILADTEDLPKEAILFLSTCKKMLRKGSAEPILKKYPVIIKMFRSLSEEFAKTEFLNKFLRKQTRIAKESVSCCIISFRDVYQHLKDSLNSQSIELPKQQWKHVRKLELFMQKLLEKLKELEDAEIDFDDDDEDNSAYIKHDKYSQRLNKVYKKYCEILKKNPYAGRITHERLDFVSSSHNEINQAISKKYKNNKKFPSYDELSAFIQTVVEEKKLSLSGADLKIECELCFKKLGDLLQTRRKKELYEVHQKYMTEEDPAKNNDDLEKRLRISFKEGKVRIDQICQEYVKKQELGVVGEEVDLSESENNDEDNPSDIEE